MKQARFRKLMRQHKNRIYSHAYYFLGNRQDAEDITQEVLLKMWKNMDMLSRRAANTWIFRVTRNLCIDYTRKKKLLCQSTQVPGRNPYVLDIPAQSPEFDPEKQMERTELRERIECAIGQLPETLRSVIIMREIQNLKYEEISRVLDIPLNSVKVYVYRARRILREKLSPFYGNEKNAML